MNENILNKALLEKNIEQINYYIEEEKQLLNKIFEKMELCLKDYNTSNTAKYLEKITDSKLNVSKISTKRTQYINILNNAIARYDRVSIETINRFDGEN